MNNTMTYNLTFFKKKKYYSCLFRIKLYFKVILTFV